MNRKIYFGFKPFYFTTTIIAELEPYLGQESTFFSENSSPAEIAKAVSAIQQTSFNAAIIITTNVEESFAVFKSLFTLIQAAGGFVLTEQQEALLIFRRGKWDLPKGKLDEGEDLPICAVREVQEETGLKEVEIKEALCITYHTYHQDGDLILKESHWYMMTTPYKQVLTPQLDEDIEKCEWVPITKLAPYMENTHLSIIDVVKEALTNLNSTQQVTL